MQSGHTRARYFPTVGPLPVETTMPSPSASSASRSLVFNERIEQLIGEVEKRPALYKKDLRQYSDIKMKKKIWEEVCEVVVDNWAQLGVNERKERGHEIQRKWNNLRTCFARELKAQKSVRSGQSSSKRRPYVYFERLLFLIPCMESRQTDEGSIENQSSESNQDDAEFSEEPQSRSQPKRRVKQSDFDSQILKALQFNEDADTNYCLSLVPFMKELTSDEKLEARIRVLQIFQDIKNKRLFPNTSLKIQPSTSQFSKAPRKTTP